MNSEAHFLYRTMQLIRVAEEQENGRRDARYHLRAVLFVGPL